MRIARCAIVGAILSAIFVVGCGGDEAKPVDLTGKADTAAMKGMLEQQSKNLKGGNKQAK